MALETESRKIRVQIYYATNIDPSELPYTWYKEEHGLPEACISALETTAAKIDADALRAEKNFAIANAG